MNRRLKLLVLGLLIPAVVEAARVNVQFVDHENKPLANVESKIVDSVAKAEKARKSDKKGKLEFDKLAAGEYTVLAQKEGYLQSAKDSVEVADKDVDLTVRLVSLDVLKKLEAEGNAKFQERNFAAAIEKYIEIARLAENSPMAFANMARAYGMSRQRDKAAEAARRAAALDPANFSQIEKQVVSVTSFEDGKDLLEKKEFAKAVQAFTDCVQADPTIAEAFVGLALSYGNQRKYPEALKNIQEALRLRPGDQGFLDIEKTLKHNAAITTK